ncbi:23S rRNA (pseudouridine(1915)-N(3))-methyltransferase RlmH, partial [Candidatus Peregrinibacteria bacterium]|nr:23S rRNA (pseudouridine(1915)-N(3))-methyltransferase RlmH [Candidatus Peregrinibacteria bacterium]
MKIKILQVGKTKEKNIAVLIEEFIKRLSPYVELEMVFVKEVLHSKTFSIERVKE